MIRLKRVYDPPEPEDGQRFLVDRRWPRGVKKDSLEITAWLRDIAPSDALRTWFNHDPAKWEEFQQAYHQELDRKPEVWQPLQGAARQGTVTLLFAARDVEHNNAVALKDYLQRRET